MASVDAKLLKQTKFPPEFNQKVDMTKVNIEVMKKWIAGKLSVLLGNEDDVIIELCFNLLEGSRFPDIKSLQIQLTGFLDKDTPKFCQELWNLCLSAQSNPQGVAKELLEAKKLELRQEKLDAEKAAEEARRQKEQERAREREIENLRQKERAERPRNWRGGGRGGRDLDRRGSRDSRSPRRRRSPDRFRGGPSRREADHYVPRGSRSHWNDGRGRRSTRSITRSRSRSPSISRSPPLRQRRSHYAERRRSNERRPPRSASRPPSPDRKVYRRDIRRSPDCGDDRARPGIRSDSAHSPTPRRHRRKYSSASSRTPSRPPAPRTRRRRNDLSRSRSRSRSVSRSRSPRLSSQSPPLKSGPRRRGSLSDDTKADKRGSRADVGKGRTSRDYRRLSRSRSRSRSRNRSINRKRRGSDQCDRGRTRTRSISSRRDRSRSRSPRRDKKRRRSLERYAPAGRRRRNTSSVSAPDEKRQRTAELEDTTMHSPPVEHQNSRDDRAKQSRPNPISRISTNELREKVLREKLKAMRRKSPNDKKD